VNRIEKNRMHAHRLFLAAVLGTLLCAGDAGAQNPILDQFIHNELGESNGQGGFLSPTGRFRFRVPSGFEQEENNNPDTLMFIGQVSGYPAKLIIRRIDVTPGASSSQLMLTTRDRFLQKLPNFTVLKQGSAKIAGRACATMIGRYDYQGNKGYPQIIENGYVVDGGDGFIIHVEVQEAAYNYAAREIADIYKTFRTIAPPTAAPVAPPPADSGAKKPSKKP
jgi:hypothetical protein